MDDWVKELRWALGQAAYERWVEANEGVVSYNGETIGLPPWTNSKHPGNELSDHEKEIWAQVAITSISVYKAANVESPRTIAITDDMINSIRSARLVGADERTYVLGVLMLAGFKVVDE